MKIEKIRFVHDTPYSGHYEKYFVDSPDYGENTADLSSWSPTVNELHNSDLGGGRVGQYDYPRGLDDVKDFTCEPNFAVLRKGSLDRTEVEEALEKVTTQVELINDDTKDKVESLKKQANQSIKALTDTHQTEKTTE